MKFKYSYEELLAKDFTDLVDICLNNTLINDNQIYDFSKNELISKLHENFIKPVEEMIAREKEDKERIEKEAAQRREFEKEQEEERKKEKLRQEEEGRNEELRQQEQRWNEELRQEEEREKERAHNEKEKNDYDNIEKEINKFFTDISKIDIGSIFDNVNDAIININQDDVINKGSKFAHDVVKGFGKFVEESISEEVNTEKYKSRYEENYIPILSLEENEYNYSFKNKFVNAFRRFRILGESEQKILVVKKIDNQFKLEKVTFNFDTNEDILNVKCEVDSNNVDINSDTFNFIFLEDDINDSLIKTAINLVSNLKVEMLEDNEIIREINLINEYINSGEINILLGFKSPEIIKESKIVFYENVKGERQIIIDESKKKCDVRRIKTAKSFKIFTKSNLSQQKIEVINIDLTNLKVNIASAAEHQKYKKISEVDLIISFKKIDNDKLSYRIFLKENGKLMHSDKFITLY